MASNVEAKNAGDVVIWEADFRYSREMRTVKTGATIVIGDVLGDDTGLTPLVADAGPPADTDAEAIALEAITSAAASAQILCLVRTAVYNIDQATYGAASTQAQADAALLALGLVGRLEAPA